VKIIRAGERPSVPGAAEQFTGTVWIDEIAVGTAPSNLRVHAVHFEPGARTAWHTHPIGQVLHVLDGVGRVQRDGGVVETIQAGDTVVVAPGERHWHGAAPERFFTHVVVQEASDSGEEATWGAHVEPEEYSPDDPAT
jgi:quercetin dioxygenase-like cupin family protein